MADEIPPLLRGLRRNYYATVVADPPWHYRAWSGKGCGRAAEHHYSTMDDEAIAALPVGNYAAKDAKLLMWITGPMMAVGTHLPIMAAWGFKPTAIFQVWVKPTQSAWNQGALFLDHERLWKMGMGHTSRQNCEFVIEARRGSPAKRKAADVRQEIIEPAREHSRKPEKFYQNVERYAAAPFLELFGRQQRRGWTVRGDERDKFGKAKR